MVEIDRGTMPIKVQGGDLAHAAEVFMKFGMRNNAWNKSP